VIPALRERPEGGARVDTSSPASRALAHDALLRGAGGAALAVRSAAVFAFFGVESFLPLALSTVRGASAAEVASILTLSALAWTAGAFVQARACRGWSARDLTRAGTLGLVAGIACATLGLFEPTPIAVALAGWTLAGFGMGVVYSTATASAMDAAPAGAEGAAGSALGIADAVAAGLATALGGVFVAAAPLAAGETPLWLVAAFALAALVGSTGWLDPARYCLAIPTRASAVGSR